MNNWDFMYILEKFKKSFGFSFLLKEIFSFQIKKENYTKVYDNELQCYNAGNSPLSIKKKQKTTLYGLL